MAVIILCCCFLFSVVFCVSAVKGKHSSLMVKGKDVGGGSSSSSNKTFCFCHGKEEGFMICCDACEEWFHVACVGLTKRKVLPLSPLIILR